MIWRDGAGPAHTVLGSYFICTKQPVCGGAGAAEVAVGLSGANGERGELSVQGVFSLIYCMAWRWQRKQVSMSAARNWVLQRGVGGKSCSPRAAQPFPASCVHLWSVLTLGETTRPDTGSVPQAPLRALGAYVWWWHLVSMGLTLTWVTLLATFSWKETLAWLKPFRRKLALKSFEWDGTSSTL